MGNPNTFLRVKQGVLQYVIFKPIFGVVIMILKEFDLYDEGYIDWKSSYLWLNLMYNLSVCTAMYCLVLFYLQCERDLKPYRPMSKFICVKSLIFLTFWQGFFLAFLVKYGVLTDGTKYSKGNISQAIQDALLCIEMPLFAWLHWYAFPCSDYEDKRLSSRLKFVYAVKDAIGIKDIIIDTRITFSNVFRLIPVPEIVLHDDEVMLLRQTGRDYGSYARSLAFEIDESEDRDYTLSRNMVFGDYQYPVIHDDWRNPPDIQLRMDQSAREFYDRINTSSTPPPPLRWDDAVYH
jgi:hypothetical protein